MVANKTFRSDLLHRLEGIRIDVPPLRARPADIVPLAEFFAAHAAARDGFPRPLLGGLVKSALCAYDWPGNVRELRNAVERAMYLSQGAPLERRHLRLDAVAVEHPTPVPPKRIR
jgi:DNA-binding NtrC family response regulator